MCGFVGFTGNKVGDSDKAINNMAKAIEHRGPDEANFHCDENISLGFRQLSFFRESHDKQPFQNEEKTLTIVYNGDVDNSPQSLLQLYKEHGEDMVHHATGGFAFVIFDHTTGEVFAARDHFGIKPLYYAVIEGELVFASELKAFFAYPLFEKKINLEALEQYLSFQYSVLDESFFKGVFRLPPAHFLKFKGDQVQLQRYWQAEYSPQERSIEDIVDDIDDVVIQSVNRHKTEGALLSSGLDSSYITSVSKDLKKTFTVGFDYAGFSEIEMAQQLSKEKSVENFNKVITTEEFWDVLPKFQYYIDEPLADPAAVAFYFACQIAKENGIECVFSGEGADEFFGGYGIYKEPVDLAPLTRFPLGLRKALACVARAIPFKFKGKNYVIRAATPVEKRFIGNAYIFTEKERADILKTPTGAKISDVVDPIYNVPKNQDDVTKMQHLDVHLWMVGDIMHIADRISMVHSLEIRVPFADKAVFDVASKTPTRYRVNKQATKYAFRKAATRHFTDRRPKNRLGFPVPTRLWLQEEKYYNIVLDAFKQDFVGEFFQMDKLMKLLNDHKSKKVDNGKKIWTIYTFILWHQEYFKNNV